MKLKIANSEHEGWERCGITGREFYLNKGLNFFIGIEPISYDEGIRYLRQAEAVEVLKTPLN